MWSWLNGYCAINMSMNDCEMTNKFGIQFAGSFVIQNEAFVAWLVVMVAMFGVVML